VQLEVFQPRRYNLIGINATPLLLLDISRMSVELLLTKYDVAFPASGISQAQRTDFFVGKKVGKKPPKPHATLNAAPAPRASWPTRRCGDDFVPKS
ncbi:MAG: hypothetical protein AAF399_27180, partial [Bacteroidota bacterium]